VSIYQNIIVPNFKFGIIINSSIVEEIIKLIGLIYNIEYEIEHLISFQEDTLLYQMEKSCT